MVVSKPPILVVAAALFGRRGVLLQQRPAGKSQAGLWEFPGGKVEPGEGPRTALVRELREELGIVVDPAQLTPMGFGADEAPPLVLLLFGCDSWAGDPQPLEATAIQWCDRQALLAAIMPPLDRPLVPLVSAALSA